MKTDLVLTMDEYLAECCVVPKHVSPPAPEARHVPITTEHDVEFGTKAHGCRCDRWGHPYPGDTCGSYRSDPRGKEINDSAKSGR